MSDTRQDEGEQVRYKAKATIVDDFFSNILAKPDVTYNTISLSWDPAPRRSLR